MTIDRTSPPHRNRGFIDRDTAWAIPVGSIGKTQLNVSYSIFIAASILLTVVLIAKGQPGNADLPRAAMIGVAIWIAGWITQVLVHAMFAWVCELSVPTLTLGMVGVETMPRSWPARSALAVTLGTITSLVALAIAFRLIEGGGRLPVLSSGGADVMTELFSPPSLGMTAADSMWRAAAWLCSLQAVCQMFPLPRTLGRQAYAALASICGRRLDLASQVRLFRRCLIAIAIVTLVLAIYVLSQESTDRVPRWPLLFGLSLMLWISAHRPDVMSLLRGFQLADFEGGEKQAGEGLAKRVTDHFRSRRLRQRVRAAMENERTEAVDASKLDEILQRLHSQGQASLSDEDRKVLTRVSERIRQSRQQES